MYRWLRNAHLYFGLFCWLYVLVYGVSSVKMSHRNWFPVTASMKVSQVPIPAAAATSARAVARELMDHHGLSGELTGGKETPDGYSFQLVKAGLRYLVDYSRAKGEAHIIARKPDFLTMLVGLHTEHGLWHEDPVRQALGIFVAIVSAALVILSLSGIYLWFQLHAERRVGAILLAVSLGYSLTVMFLLGSA